MCYRYWQDQIFIIDQSNTVGLLLVQLPFSTLDQLTQHLSKRFLLFPSLLNGFKNRSNKRFQFKLKSFSWEDDGWNTWVTLIKELNFLPLFVVFKYSFFFSFFFFISCSFSNVVVKQSLFLCQQQIELDCFICSSSSNWDRLPAFIISSIRQQLIASFGLKNKVMIIILTDNGFCSISCCYLRWNLSSFQLIFQMITIWYT